MLQHKLLGGRRHGGADAARQVVGGQRHERGRGRGAERGEAGGRGSQKRVRSWGLGGVRCHQERPCGAVAGSSARAGGSARARGKAHAWHAGHSAAAHLLTPEGALTPLSRASSWIWRGVRDGSCIRSRTVIWPRFTMYTWGGGAQGQSTDEVTTRHNRLDGRGSCRLQARNTSWGSCRRDEHVVRCMQCEMVPYKTGGE